MAYLIANFCFVIFLGLFSGSYDNKSKNIKFFMWGSFVLLFIVHSFVKPDSVPDLPNYLDAYEELSYYSFFDLPDSILAYSYELGFLYFMKTISILSTNFTFFLCFFSFILLSCYYKVIREYSPFIFVSILLFLVTIFDQSIFVLRQHLAMAVLLLSWRYIINKDFIRFAFILLIAFSFHVSALVYLPLYFLYNIRNNKKYIVLVMLGCVVMSFAFFSIMEYVGLAVMDNSSTYLYNEKYDGSNYKEAIMMLLLLSSMVFFMRRDVFKPGINRLVFSIMCIGTLGALFGVGISATGRLFAYFTTIPYILVPIVMKYIKNKHIRWSYAVSIILLYSYISYFGTQASCFDSYRLISLF